MSLTEIRFPAEISGRQTVGAPYNPVPPIILKHGTSDADAIRIAKSLGSMLGHFKAEVVHDGAVAKIDI